MVVQKNQCRDIELQEQDIHEQRKKSRDRASSNLKELVALEEVKSKVKEIHDIARIIRSRKYTLGIDESVNFHMLLLGEKGYGKKTIGRIIKDIFFAEKIIADNYFYVEEAKNIYPGYDFQNKMDGADSGIIFIKIDSLFESNNNKMQQINFIPKIINEMRNLESKFSFIFSGSRKSYNNLLQIEANLKNNFQFKIDFKLYSDDDAVKIARSIARKNYKFKITTAAKKSFLEILRQYESVNRNYYTIDNIIRKAIIQHYKKMNIGNVSERDLNYLRKSDFLIEKDKGNNENKNKKQCIKKDNISALDELDSMIGLESVKKKIKNMVNYIKLQKLREEAGIETEPISLHLSFSGNPGTGKTTVARLIGKIYYELGLLNKESFIETDRTGLVGPYIGQTEQKTQQQIRKAMGGVLFVDEAYSLQNESEKDYGHIAVSTLIKEMEDKRNDLAIIFAGYKKEMKDFIGMNPGLKSRISNHIDFEDYKPNDLLKIFYKFCVEEKYTPVPDLHKELLKLFEQVYKYKGQNFSNGRTVRNIFEQVKLIQAERLIGTDAVTKDDLNQITLEDIKKLYNSDTIQSLLKSNIVCREKIGFIA